MCLLRGTNCQHYQILNTNVDACFPSLLRLVLHALPTAINVTLIDFQLDAQNSYLFIYNTFIKTLYMFRALPCSSSGGPRRTAASGIVTLCT